MYRFDTTSAHSSDTSYATTSVPTGEHTTAPLYKLSKLLNNQTIKLINHHAVFVSENISDWIKASNVQDEVKLPFDTENFKNHWDQWKIYKKKEFRFSYKSAQSEQSTLIKLSEISENENHAINLILNAMANGWKGIYPINDKNGNNDNGIDSNYEEELRQRINGIQS